MRVGKDGYSSMSKDNGDNLNCATKYPIVLVHGVGFRQRKFPNYWGRIPKQLKHRGAQIFYTCHDAWGTLEANGAVIRENILEVLRDTGADKVNIIAHSNGGLESRYVIHSLEMAPYVASLTTVCTCHHGSKTIDHLLKLPKTLFRIAAFFVNGFFRIMGDKKPDFDRVCTQFSTAFCKDFNEKNPDADAVVYRSYAAKMKSGRSDFLLMVPYWVVKNYDGDNDGLVSVESARWGNFMGILEGEHRRGISHSDAVDLRRHTGKSFDICSAYVALVEDLKKAGL